MGRLLELGPDLFTLPFTWNAHGTCSDMWICLHACEFDHTVNAFLSFPSPTEFACVHETHTHTHIITTRFSKVALFSSTLRQNMLDGCQES